MLEAFSKIHTQLGPVQDDHVKKTPNIQELADWAYALSECEKMLDRLRKDAKAAKEMAEKICCLLYTKLGEGGPIRTEHVTATPRVKFMASIPKQSTNPEAFARLMEHLGIPREMWEKDVVRPHWPGFTDFFTECLEAGKPLPPGIDPDKTYPLYALTLRKRKDIEESSVSAPDEPDEEDPF